MFFKFNLAGDAPGWAHPTLGVDDLMLEMTASYLSDALAELLEALMLLVNGSPTASCEWTQEPGGWWWDFTRPDAEQVDVVIAFKDDVMSEPWVTGSAGQVRLKARTALVELVGAVATGARRCLDEWGASGFARQWNMHPFPLMQLEALERWVIARKLAPLYAWT